MNNKKGFTLAELLIVVAIIAVLVAISIPIFNQQLEKSREATDLANMRAAKSLGVAAYYDIETDGSESAMIDGLERKGTGGGGVWYEGFYDPTTGTFISNPAGNYQHNLTGHGTAVDTGSDYGMRYRSAQDYKNSGIFVQIVMKSGNSTPKIYVNDEVKALFNGNDVGVHVQWRTLWDNHSIESDKGYDFAATY